MVRLEKITQKIIDDANEKARLIIEEAQEKCDAINLECEQKMSAIQDSMYTDALSKGEHIKSKSMSEVAMNKRDIMLSMKNRLVDEVFLSAIKEIVELDAERYRELMTQLLCRVLSEQIESEKDSMRLYGENISPDKYEVIMNKRDKEAHGQYIVAGVRRATVGKIGGYILDKVFLSNNTADIEGGIILKCGDIEINASFESIASELRGELEGGWLRCFLCLTTPRKINYPRTSFTKKSFPEKNLPRVGLRRTSFPAMKMSIPRMTSMRIQTRKTCLNKLKIRNIRKTNRKKNRKNLRTAKVLIQKTVLTDARF